MRMHAALLSALLILTGSSVALPIHVPNDPAHPGIGLPLLAPPLLWDFPAAWSVAVDSKGSVVLGTADQRGAAGVQVYDASGKLVWQRAYPGDYDTTVTVDRDDNVIVAGHVIHKYYPNGELQWEKPIWGVVSLATDEKSNIYIAALSLTDAAVVYKLTPNGVTLWRSVVSVPGASEDNAQGIAVSPDGYVALVTFQHTVSLDPNGNLLWRANTGGYRVAIDEAHNVYTGRQLNDLVLGFINRGYLVKFTPTGTTAWTLSEPAGQVVLARGVILAINEFAYGGLPGPTAGVKGWVVDAYDTNTGLWQWGFKHVTGTWCCFQALISGNAYYRPGYLAITGTGYGVFDSPLYKMDGLAHVCDSTPVLSPPDLARACVFTPL